MPNRWVREVVGVGGSWEGVGGSCNGVKIVGGRYYREFSPQIHELQQLSFIYSFCQNKLDHRSEGDRDRVLDYYNTTLTIQQSILPTDHADMGTTHTNLDNLHSELDEYDTVMKHQNLSLNIRQKALPPQHSDFARSCGNIGLVFEEKGELETAADMTRSSLPPEHVVFVEIGKYLERVS